MNHYQGKLRQLITSALMRQQLNNRLPSAVISQIIGGISPEFVELNQQISRAAVTSLTKKLWLQKLLKFINLKRPVTAPEVLSLAKAVKTNSPDILIANSRSLAKAQSRQHLREIEQLLSELANQGVADNNVESRCKTIKALLSKLTQSFKLTGLPNNKQLSEQYRHIEQLLLLEPLQSNTTLTGNRLAQLKTQLSQWLFSEGSDGDKSNKRLNKNSINSANQSGTDDNSKNWALTNSLKQSLRTILQSDAKRFAQLTALLNALIRDEFVPVKLLKSLNNVLAEPLDSGAKKLNSTNQGQVLLTILTQTLQALRTHDGKRSNNQTNQAYAIESSIAAELKTLLKQSFSTVTLMQKARILPMLALLKDKSRLITRGKLIEIIKKWQIVDKMEQGYSVNANWYGKAATWLQQLVPLAPINNAFLSQQAQTASQVREQVITPIQTSLSKQVITPIQTSLSKQGKTPIWWQNLADNLLVKMQALNLQQGQCSDDINILAQMSRRSTLDNAKEVSRLGQRLSPAMSNELVSEISNFNNGSNNGSNNDSPQNKGLKIAFIQRILTLSAQLKSQISDQNIELAELKFAMAKLLNNSLNKPSNPTNYAANQEMESTNKQQPMKYPWYREMLKTVQSHQHEHRNASKRLQDKVGKLTKSVKAQLEQLLEDEDGDDFLGSDDSGLVILWPFLTQLFNSNQLLNDSKKRFKDKNCQYLAWALLSEILGIRPHAGQLTAKILVGLDINDEYAQDINVSPSPLTAEQLGTIEPLLTAVSTHWPALTNTTPDLIKQLFFQRQGLWQRKGFDWRVEVPSKSHDILKKTLPWGIGTIRLPWLEYTVHVDWA